MPKKRKKRDPRIGRKVYGYFSAKGRYIGKVPLNFFLRKCAEADRASVNWVRERYSPTGNKKEIALAMRHPGKIIFIREGRKRGRILRR